MNLAPRGTGVLATRRERGRRLMQIVAQLLAAAVLAWAAWWLHISFTQWSRDHRCLLVAGPFLRCGPGPHAWKLPLIIGLLPLAGVGLWCAVCMFLRRRRGAREEPVQ